MRATIELSFGGAARITTRYEQMTAEHYNGTMQQKPFANGPSVENQRGMARHSASECAKIIEHTLIKKCGLDLIHPKYSTFYHVHIISHVIL